MYFRKYGLRKPSLDECVKSPVSKGPSKRNMVKGGQTLCKSEPQSLLLICKIFGLFVNTLTAARKFSLLNTENLTQPIEMQLIKNEKAFSPFFFFFMFEM